MVSPHKPIPKRRAFLVAALAAFAVLAAMPAAAAAADRTPPTVRGPYPSWAFFSPNGDGARDRASVLVRVSEPGLMSAAVVDGRGRPLAWLARGKRVSAGSVRLTWSGRRGSGRHPDGKYRLKVWVRDWAGNRSQRWPALSTIVLDTRRPSARTLGVGPSPFSPNGDRRRDWASFRATGSEVLWGRMWVFNGTTRVARRTGAAARILKVLWNGKDDAGRRVADGTYRVVLVPYDRAGNPASPLRGSVRIDCTPPSLTHTASVTTVTANGDGDDDSVRLDLDLGETARLIRRLYTPERRTLSSLSLASAAPGSYHMTWDATSRDETVPTGRYLVYTYAEDPAGNRTYASRRITVESYLLVMLDPGHGGLVGTTYDTGAVGFSAWDPIHRRKRPLYESEANLAITYGRTVATVTAQKGVAHFLQERTINGLSVRARHTRTKERAPNLTLSRRAFISNYYEPNVFVSVHNNDAANRNAIGTETLMRSGTREAYLAQRIQKQVAYRIYVSGLNPEWNRISSATGRPRGDRGVKDGNWLYLARHVDAPMALLEGGFVNNADENRLLRTDEYRQVLARGVADGITDYFDTAFSKGWIWW